MRPSVCPIGSVQKVLGPRPADSRRRGGTTADARDRLTELLEQLLSVEEGRGQLASFGVRELLFATDVYP
jgi:hypothetical protein